MIFCSFGAEKFLHPGREVDKPDAVIACRNAICVDVMTTLPLFRRRAVHEEERLQEHKCRSVHVEKDLVFRKIVEEIARR